MKNGNDTTIIETFKTSPMYGQYKVICTKNALNYLEWFIPKRKCGQSLKLPFNFYADSRDYYIFLNYTPNVRFIYVCKKSTLNRGFADTFRTCTSKEFLKIINTLPVRYEQSTSI